MSPGADAGGLCVFQKAIFLGLVNKRSSDHSVLQQVTYQQFKQEMLQFCQSLFPFSHPFLSRVRVVLPQHQSGCVPSPYIV